MRASQPIHSRRTPLRRLASRNAQQLFRSDALLLGRVTYEGFKRENRGDILMYGSAMLGQTLVEHDLIDEIRLMVHRHRRARSASAGGRGHDKDVAVGRYHTDWFWDRDDAVRTGTLTHSEHTRW